MYKALYNTPPFLCLIKADTASEAMPTIGLNKIPSSAPLCLLDFSNLGNRRGISSKISCEWFYDNVEIEHPNFRL